MSDQTQTTGHGSPELDADAAILEAMGADPGPTLEEIGGAIASLAKGFDDELFALSQEDLAAQWYFTWDDRGGLAWNLYQFSDMLEMHKRRCRRWEEHHHGHVCVVERVRDKYLMPRVKAFLIELSERSATNG